MQDCPPMPTTGRHAHDGKQTDTRSQTQTESIDRPTEVRQILLYTDMQGSADGGGGRERETHAPSPPAPPHTHAHASVHGHYTPCRIFWGCPPSWRDGCAGRGGRKRLPAWAVHACTYPRSERHAQRRLSERVPFYPLRVCANTGLVSPSEDAAQAYNVPKENK